MTGKERSLEEIHAVLSKILDAGSIPVGVGGCHVQSYGFIMAVAVGPTRQRGRAWQGVAGRDGAGLGGTGVRPGVSALVAA
ncbi:MAG: hypothetical protein WD072_05635 [Pirellulales bacterium]